MSDQPYFETKTDNNGLLVVRSHSLPIFDYYLQITPTNSKTFILTINEFINKNNQYLKNNKINLMIER